MLFTTEMINHMPTIAIGRQEDVPVDMFIGENAWNMTTLLLIKIMTMSGVNRPNMMIILKATNVAPMEFIGLLAETNIYH